MKTFWLAWGLLCVGMAADAQKPKVKPPDTPALITPGSRANGRPGRITARVRPLCPIRLGGVFTLGLGDSGNLLEDSAAQSVKLSEENRQWIAANCDVVSLPASCLMPDTFPKIVKEQPLFTGLLFLFGSTISESGNAWGNVGGWQPRMTAWTLRGKDGQELPNPDKQAHWMDYGNAEWAVHWSREMFNQARKYGAAGSVIAELPTDNALTGGSFVEGAVTTGNWLRAAHKPNPYLFIPSAAGFDELAGHATLPTPPGTEEPELSGRLWDEFFPAANGAWDENWLAPCGSDELLPEDTRERHMEAADRAARNDMVYIAAGAYHNDAELEFLLASYLLVVHKQGRLVFQPMPQLPFFEREDAGHSFAVFRQQIMSRRAYFDVPLGGATQERHLLPGLSTRIWRRAFQAGAVYVNSEDNRSETISFGGPVRRVNGEIVRQIVLPPHSGAILLDM